MKKEIPFDEIVVLVALFLMYELLLVLYCHTPEKIVENEVQPIQVVQTVTPTVTPKPTEAVTEEEPHTSHLEEKPEFSAVMYATEPIGRYYITAYNHLETGSKLTASGKTCHEGTITTCASDTRYLPFGTYIEVGGRIYRCEDTGSAVKKKHVDLYFSSYKQMARYNSHYEVIYKVTFPFGKPAD